MPDWCDMPVQEAVLTEITETPLEGDYGHASDKNPGIFHGKGAKESSGEISQDPADRKAPCSAGQKGGSAACPPVRRNPPDKSAKNKLGLGNFLDSLLGGRRW